MSLVALHTNLHNEMQSKIKSLIEKMGKVPNDYPHSKMLSLNEFDLSNNGKFRIEILVDGYKASYVDSEKVIDERGLLYSIDTMTESHLIEFLTALDILSDTEN